MKILFVLLLLSLLSCKNKISNTTEQKSIDLLNDKTEEAFEEKRINSNNYYGINVIEEAILNITLKEFYCSYVDNEIGLHFDLKKNTYKLTGGGPEWIPIVDGVFDIKNSTIYLTPLKVNLEYDFNWIIPNLLKKIKEEWELKYIEIEDNLYYTKGLNGKGIIFYDINSWPNEGEVRIVDGIEIITMKQGYYKPRENARVRNGPGVQYEIFIIDGNDYLPAGKGMDMFILGHSKNVDTQNGLTGYWYYGQMVLFFDTDVKNPNGGDSPFGWIFGPLLEPLIY